MATTTNYGWTTPDNTDLVKDGALAIRTLGSAIDTSMNTALGTKKAGMVLLNTTSFSGVASQQINSVFSSTYQNYRIVLNYVLTGASTMKFRVSASGTPVTSTTYRRAGWYYFSTAASGHFDASNSGTAFNLADSATAFTTIDLFRPFEAATTGFIAQTSHDTGTNNIGLVLSGLNTNATSYDGFQLSPDANNMTGRVTVYGYNI